MKTVQAKKQMSEKLRISLNITVGFLIVASIGAIALHYLLPPISPGFLTYPMIVRLHVITAAVWILLAPFQLIRQIRSRWPKYHRWAGRGLMVMGLLIGLSALFMAWITPIADWAERVIIGFYGLFFLFALGKGFYHIRTRQPVLHREWMLRAFALGLAPATLRLIEIPRLIIAGDQFSLLAYIIETITVFTLHAVVAELWIRATRRKKRVPAVALNELKASSEISGGKREDCLTFFTFAFFHYSGRDVGEDLYNEDIVFTF